MLGRRNLNRADRDEIILRLAARGVKQKDIAEKVGLSKMRINQIVNDEESKEILHSPTINSTPAAEIESLQRKLEEAEAARRGMDTGRDRRGGWGIAKNSQQHP